MVKTDTGRNHSSGSFLILGIEDQRIFQECRLTPKDEVDGMRAGSERKALLLLICMMSCFLVSPVNLVHAGGHKESTHQFKKTGGHRLTKDGHTKKDDRGNETTGEIAAWMFGVANFPVALSIILKTLANFDPPRLNFRDPLTRFNRRQKKYLMKLHYWLNPIALGIALTHFLLSACRSTAFPEWGLGVMLAAALLGMMVKFKLSPASMRQNLFRFHTNPILLIAGILILLIGHTIVD